MLGYCNYLNDLNNRCARTNQLHDLLFRDPYSPSFIQVIQLCDFHYREITTELTERISNYRIEIKNKKFEIAKFKEAEKQHDVYYDKGRIYQQISDMESFIRNTLMNECKNFFCKRNLNELKSIGAKIYSVTTFNQSGKRHYTFYYCSLKCFNTMKGKCGISIPIHSGQLSL